MEQKVALSDMLEHIADELTLAEENARQRGYAVMQFEECEVEVAVQAEKQAKGGFKIWVINLGGGIKLSDSNKLRIKFTKIPGQKPFQAPQDTEGEGPPLVRQPRTNE